MVCTYLYLNLTDVGVSPQQRAARKNNTARHKEAARGRACIKEKHEGVCSQGFEWWSYCIVLVE